MEINIGGPWYYFILIFLEWTEIPVYTHYCRYRISAYSSAQNSVGGGYFRNLGFRAKLMKKKQADSGPAKGSNKERMTESKKA